MIALGGDLRLKLPSGLLRRFAMNFIVAGVSCDERRERRLSRMCLSSLANDAALEQSTMDDMKDLTKQSLGIAFRSELMVLYPMEWIAAGLTHLVVRLLNNRSDEGQICKLRKNWLNDQRLERGGHGTYLKPDMNVIYCVFSCSPPPTNQPDPPHNHHACMHNACVHRT